MSQIQLFIINLWERLELDSSFHCKEQKLNFRSQSNKQLGIIFVRLNFNWHTIQSVKTP